MAAQAGLLAPGSYIAFFLPGKVSMI